MGKGASGQNAQASCPSDGHPGRHSSCCPQQQPQYGVLIWLVLLPSLSLGLFMPTSQLNYLHSSPCLRLCSGWGGQPQLRPPGTSWSTGMPGRKGRAALLLMQLSGITCGETPWPVAVQTTARRFQGEARGWPSDSLDLSPYPRVVPGPRLSAWHSAQPS